MPASNRIVTIFGSSCTEEHDEEYQTALAVGRLLAREGFTVCNGGYKGIMEASARGAKEAGGRTIGITTSAFEGTANPWIDEERRIPSWQERLFHLIETGEAYVLLDGGTGTLVEFFTVWEMTNKRLLAKPILVLGKFLSSLVGELKKQPEIIFNNFLKIATSAEEAATYLNTNFCRDGK
mgnify:CR=1 FL=1